MTRGIATCSACCALGFACASASADEGASLWSAGEMATAAHGRGAIAFRLSRSSCRTHLRRLKSCRRQAKPAARIQRRRSRGNAPRSPTSGSPQGRPVGWPVAPFLRRSTLRPEALRRWTAGERVLGYPAPDAAQLALADGKHVLVESTLPMAIDTGDRRSPIDLRLVRADNGFRGANAPVGLRLPRHLGEGARTLHAAAACRCSPVDGGGAALPGSRRQPVDGATVFYGDVGDDMDAAIKPTTSGFEEDTILRSASSPSASLRLRVGRAGGAHTAPRTDTGYGGRCEVVDQGEVIATILAPGAVDDRRVPPCR